MPTPVPTIKELRVEYRAILTEGAYSPAELRRRCEIYLGSRRLPRTPYMWVKAARYVLVNDQWEEEQDYEGFMGTGMSEADYYRAAGSAE